MSITFTASAAVIGYRMICCDGERRDARIWPANATTRRIDREHAASCTDPTCIEYEGGILEEIYSAPIRPVSVHNSNARLLLDALGYPTSRDGSPFSDPFEPFDHATGDADADDFAGRVLTALALTPTDEGRPAVGSVGANGARWVDGGRRPGRIQELLGELRDLAETARTHGLAISWA